MTELAAPPVEERTGVTRISHWIGGRSVAGESGRSGPVYNPATGRQTGDVDFATVEEVDRAVQTYEHFVGAYARALNQIPHGAERVGAVRDGQSLAALPRTSSATPTLRCFSSAVTARPTGRLTSSISLSASMVPTQTPGMCRPRPSGRDRSIPQRDVDSRRTACIPP